MRKHFLYILVLLCTTVVSAQELPWQKDFESANKTYEKEHFKEAIAQYQKIADKVSNSPELYFNLANAYFKVQDDVNAVYYFEKALKLAPEDKTIETNLNFARKDLKDNITIITQYDKLDIIHKSINVLTADGWAILATLFAFVVLGAFILYYVTQSSTLKRITLSLVILAFIGIIASSLAANFEYKFKDRVTAGIIFAEEVELREEAKSTAKSIKTLHEGAKVYVLENKSLWIKVRLDNQEIGWIEKNTIKEI